MISMKIAIIGAGAFGTALGGILANNGHDVVYYDVRMEGVRLGDVVAGAEYIVLCVPSAAAPEVLMKLPKNIPLIVATKGFLSDEIFAEFADYMVLSGPGFASDIKNGKETRFTVTDARLEKLFAADFVMFDKTSDKRGVLMCGALKNVYAILAGMMGLKPGTPAHEQYLTEVAEEMQALLSANDADPATVELACGIGDLRLTCGMPSRNYEFGTIIREDPEYRPQNTVEGVAALRRIRQGEVVVPEGAVKLKELLKESAKWD